MTHYGFNLQWLFMRPAGAAEPDPRVLDTVAGWGFNFIRLPCDYRFFTAPPAYPAAAEHALARVDRILDACRSRGLHLALNLHRAPGYVITGWESEPHNLWTDQRAQDAFAALWRGFATRWRGVPAADLSFDLVNEPPALGLRGFSRAAHEAVIRRTVAEIRAVDPDRPIAIDGLDGGNLAMPELTDLGLIHSGRGYQPMSVTHYRASWWPEHEHLPEPSYPCDYDGRWWDAASLREFYKPWRDVAAGGTPVHIGEFGCYEYTPDDIALRWFADMLEFFAEQRWGYSLWEFAGAFGVVGHHRPGGRFEARDGWMVDVRLLELLQAHRV